MFLCMCGNTCVYIHMYVKVHEKDMSVHVSGGGTRGGQKRASYYLEPEIQASMNYGCRDANSCPASCLNC